MSRCHLLSLGLLVLFCSAPANAEWNQRESRIETGAGPVVHQHVVVQDSASGATVTLELARFSSKNVQLKSIDNPESRNLAEVMNAGNYLTGVNGGYFDEGFAPLGLRVREGRTLSPLTRGRLMTGIIVSSDSSIRLVRLNEFSPKSRASTAIQCGPFLVDRGRTVSGLNSTKPARRTFVAVTGPEAIFGFSSSVSLSRLSSILASPTVDLKIQRALNLDGGSSSAFWFKRKDGSEFSISEYKNVRDFVAIAPR